MKSWLDEPLVQDAVGGLSAGIIGTLIGFPLDVIKTRMQTGSSGSSESSIFQVGKSILKNEGVASFYKGITPPLISLSILNTMTFTSYTFIREQYGGQNGWDVRNALAGMSCAPASGIVSTVENLVKTQMQLDNVTKRQFNGSLHCVKSLVQSYGFPVLYTGHVINTFREAAFLGNYFFMYEGMRELLLHSTHILGTNHSLGAQIAVPVAGGLSGACSWLISFPLDCIRAVVQGRPLDERKKATFTVARNLLAERGIRGLYSGASASVARAFLVSGSRFSAYEGALWLLRGGRDNVHGGAG
mmetsp:Transcript_23727/g.67016  ORF Transcript_23727/g.67016 Transcript_23727/m.67016 type:complete len:301 (+) Transcript_23727:108-1010(+)|eukprot:CAMPEP_0119550870 /NCGR_PEP_ID=MMETSP1352-20130426/4306_1 /TAXON_ID=265584 /ORGANISM="Stauroneis constricta, Strain CCMP1120" /LENGTH=300 /DNA_ID=CAMNT_0007596845 /DNA_START=18 /DNA_END=920 /DNA_ORIENTATION=-